MEALAIGLCAFLVLALVVSAYRSRVLCVLSVRDGQLLVMRGKLPASALAALGDVMARGRVARATLLVARDGDRARVTGRGLDEFTLQRARNVIGTYPLARLLAGPRPAPRNLGQRLGLAWLGWLLRQRR